MLLPNFSNTISLLFLFFTLLKATESLNLTLPHQHPSPDSVALHVIRSVNASLTRRQLSSPSSCRTGNPIDDCWKCADSDWSSNRQRLTDCSIGFGRGTLGGKDGKIYVVTDSSDNNPTLPLIPAFLAINFNGGLNTFLTMSASTFCSSFARDSLMASTFDASLSRVHPPPTTIPPSTAGFGALRAFQLSNSSP